MNWGGTLGSIVVHFDGEITEDHRVTARTLGTTLTHLQSAIDRAHLDIKYGSVWKHARLRSDDYEATEFLLTYPEEGGFIISLIRNGARELVRRVQDPVMRAFEESRQEGERQFQNLEQQLVIRRGQLAGGVVEARTYDDLLDRPDRKMVRAFGDRSIVKEIDQVLSLIRAGEGDRTLELTFESTQTANVTFDRRIASNFHKVVSRRSLGDPVLYSATLRSLDAGNRNQGRKGKVRNLANGRDVVLHITSQDDFDVLRPFVGADQAFNFVGAPVLEYDSFDPYGGDIYFIQIVGAV